MIDYEKPIPFGGDGEPYSEKAFIDSPLIPVEESGRIEIAMQYPVLGCKNAETRCLGRKEAVERLYQAAALLPEGYRFRIWDFWRPFALQAELFDFYKPAIVAQFHLEDMPEEELHRFMNQFVARPNPDPDCPPGHTTGGAIDLTIVGPDGKELEMGTAFDAFSDLTHAAYFEREEAAGLPHADEIRKNRRLLYNVMTAAGFAGITSEWWHFCFGERCWAEKMKHPAVYRGIFEYE